MSSKLNPEIRFWLILLGIFAGLVSLNGVLSLALAADVMPYAVVPFQNTRAQSLMNRMGAIAASPKKLAFVIGSSEIEGFFDPTQLDRECADRGSVIDTYNMGFRKLHPVRFRALAYRLRDEMSRRGRRVSYVFVHIPRVRLTTRDREMSRNELNGRFLEERSILHVADDIRSGRVSRLFQLVHDFLNDDLRAINLQSWLRLRLLRAQQDLDPGASANFRLTTAPEYMEYPAWNIATKGMYTFNNEHVSHRALFEEMHSAAALDWAERYYQECCDMYGAHFDPTSIREVVEGLVALREIADHVAVFDLPETPASYAKMKPDARDRAREMMGAISSQAGVTELDVIAGISWEPRDFVDIRHPSAIGARKLAGFFADWISSGEAKARKE